MDARRDSGLRGVEADRSPAPAVARAVGILDLLAEDAATPLGTSEIARRLQLPKSSVANICAALVDSGLLCRVGNGFSLGHRLAEFGGAYLAGVDQVREFRDACQTLPVASEETVQLAVLDRLDVVYLARHEGRQPIRLVSEIGRRLPASCTAAGKAALACLSPVDLADRLHGITNLPGLTGHSHRLQTALLADLETTRRRGYAIDDEETADGVVCFAVVVPERPDGRGPATGPCAVSVALLKARASDQRRDLLLSDLSNLARRLAPSGREMFRAARSGSVAIEGSEGRGL
jgi:IclR family transcriptional regulator, blcABC operon repressor